jgi:hypothetical protein
MGVNIFSVFLSDFVRLDEHEVACLHYLHEVQLEQGRSLLRGGEDESVNHAESKVPYNSIISHVELPQVLEVFQVTISLEPLLLLKDVAHYQTRYDDDVLNDFDEFERLVVNQARLRVFHQFEEYVSLLLVAASRVE